MELNARIIRQIILASLAVLIVPIFVFPERFGTNLVTMSLTNAMLELVFYGIVIYGLNRNTSLAKLVVTSVACFVYRLMLGAALGLIIAVMYSMDLRVSMSLSVFSYLPALLLQMVATPFVLWPVFKQFDTEKRSRLIVKPLVPVEAPEQSTHDKPVNEPVDKIVHSEAFVVDPTVTSHDADAGSSSTVTNRTETNGFEQAMRYVGEAASVRMAAVVDREGLTLGSFSRGDIEVERWAPYALVFFEQNTGVLKQTGGGAPESIDLNLTDDRLIIAFEDSFCLMVLAERQQDDVLSIRMSQSLEMIRKYIAERYSRELFVNVEKTYVRSTQ